MQSPEVCHRQSLSCGRRRPRSDPARMLLAALVMPDGEP